MLLDATGYRGMLRASRAETTEERLENLQELVQLAGGFHTARKLLDHAALSTGGPDEEKIGRMQLMTLQKAKGLELLHVFLPAWEAGVFRLLDRRDRLRRGLKALAASGQLGYGIPEKSSAEGLERPPITSATIWGRSRASARRRFFG